MSVRVSALILLLPLLSLAKGALAESPPDTPEPLPEKLRQTGEAAGHLQETPKDLLCERAEDRAWKLVWASCPRRKQVEDAVTSNCITTDFLPDADGDRGAKLAVEVQVEYRCR
jgi:hypothetical protein